MTSLPIQLHDCNSSYDDPVALASCGAAKTAATAMNWNTVTDLQAFQPPAGIVYLNTLTDLKGCNLTSVRSSPATTENDIADVPNNTEHCALYCAHEKCDSAKSITKSIVLPFAPSAATCTISKPGARGMKSYRSLFSARFLSCLNGCTKHYKYFFLPLSCALKGSR